MIARVPLGWLIGKGTEPGAVFHHRRNRKALAACRLERPHHPAARRRAPVRRDRGPRPCLRRVARAWSDVARRMTISAAARARRSRGSRLPNGHRRPAARCCAGQWRRAGREALSGALAQCPGDRRRLALTGQLGDLLRQAFGFGVSDIQGHRCDCVALFVAVYLSALLPTSLSGQVFQPGCRVRLPRHGDRNRRGSPHSDQPMPRRHLAQDPRPRIGQISRDTGCPASRSLLKLQQPGLGYTLRIRGGIHSERRLTR